MIFHQKGRLLVDETIIEFILADAVAAVDHNHWPRRPGLYDKVLLLGVAVLCEAERIGDNIGTIDEAGLARVVTQNSFTLVPDHIADTDFKAEVPERPRMLIQALYRRRIYKDGIGGLKGF